MTVVPVLPYSVRPLGFKPGVLAGLSERLNLPRDNAAALRAPSAPKPPLDTLQSEGGAP